MFCKIQCNECLAPAKININYHNRGDCLVFVSYKHSMPDRGNAEHVFKKPRKIQLVPEDKSKVFKNQYIYMWFYSFQGISFQISVHFQEEEEEVSPSSKPQEETVKDTRSEAVKNLLKCRVITPVGDDIVEENKKNAFVWPLIKQKELKHQKAVFTERVK